MTSHEALRRLEDGNRRFLSDRRGRSRTTPTKPSQLVSGQAPFAVILGCSDSRVPPELVFDQGLGDLFVVRVAGNIVAPPVIGSIEYAVAALGAQLVVVLGHTRCGAVLSTLEEIADPSPDLSPNLLPIVDFLRPLATTPEAGCLRGDAEAFARHVIRANITTSVALLGLCSEILRQLLEKQRILIVGAEYSLETGAVTFLED